MALSHLNTLNKCFFLSTINFWFGIGFYNEPVTLRDHTWLLNYQDASGNPIIAIVMSNFTFTIDSSLLVLKMAVVKKAKILGRCGNPCIICVLCYQLSASKFEHCFVFSSNGNTVER